MQEIVREERSPKVRGGAGLELSRLYTSRHSSIPRRVNLFVVVPKFCPCVLSKLSLLENIKSKQEVNLPRPIPPGSLPLFALVVFRPE